MLTKHTKIIVALFTIITLVSAFCVTVKATDDTALISDETQENTDSTNDALEDANENTDSTDSVEEPNENEATETTGEEETEKDKILYEDLYVFENDVTMDKVVDGNVYIFGNNVKITGKINGNIFVFGQNVEFTSPYGKDDTEHENDNYCYIAGSAYVFGSKVTFNAVANNIYVACNDFDMSYDSYIMKDARVFASNMVFKGYITRDAYLCANTIDFGTVSDNDEENDAALIGGDLQYYSDKEISIPEKVVTGETTFNAMDNSEEDVDAGKTVADYVMDLIQVLIYTLVVYLIINWLAPKFFENSASILKSSALLSVGIGLITLIVPFIVGIILLFLLAPLSITLFTVYGLLIALSFTVVAGALTYLLKDKIGFADKKALLLIIVTIILWAIKQIHFVGGIITFAITVVGLGIIIKIVIFGRTLRLKEQN